MELNKVICDDCIEAMKKIPDNSIDSCVTDPPYGLSKEPDIKEVLTHWLNGDKYEHKSSGFMGKNWDSFVPGPKYWEELFRILKPGAHALIFGGTRTYDLLVIALRMAGFEVRDQLQWVFGTGFPKSMNIGKAISRIKGGDIKEWYGWGTQLKPAYEKIALVRKPFIEIELWKQNAWYVERNLEPIQVELQEGMISVALIPVRMKLGEERAVIVRIGRVDGSSVLMGISPSAVKVANIDWNTMLLSRKKLGERLGVTRTCITGMELEMIIGQGIYNCIQSLSIFQNFIHAKEKMNVGLPSTVFIVIEASKGEGLKLWHTQIPSALDPVILPVKDKELSPNINSIVLVRKPIVEKNISDNVLKYGTGAINIDKCRIPVNPNVDDMLRKTDRGKRETVTWEEGSGFKNENNDLTGVRPEGRWPTNILLQHHPDCKHIGFKEVKSNGHWIAPTNAGLYHLGIKNDGRDEKNKISNLKGNEIIEDWDCHIDCPIKILNDQSGFLKSGENCTRTMEGTFLEHGGLGGAGDVQTTHGDSGGAARFFYCGKASKAEKNKGCENLPEKTIGHNRFDKCGECGGYILQNPTRPSVCKCENPVRVHNTVQGNTHITVKPLKLCRYLINLITPKDGIVIDPFAGSGSILVAAKQLEFKFIGIDKDEEYCEIAKCRLGAEFNGDIDDSYSMVRVIRRPNDKSMEQKTFFELE